LPARTIGARRVKKGLIYERERRGKVNEKWTVKG
jgi:hypothetical protein